MRRRQGKPRRKQRRPETPGTRHIVVWSRSAIGLSSETNEVGTRRSLSTVPAWIMRSLAEATKVQIHWIAGASICIARRLMGLFSA
jgi:hypothetical protein